MFSFALWTSFPLTRDNQTKSKGAVEEVDVRFCNDNSPDKVDLGNKYEEAGKEGNDCCRDKDVDLHHPCSMKKKYANMKWLQIKTILQSYKKFIIWQYSNSNLISQEQTLPEAQRTQGIAS